jgi:hypothetical protein
MTQIHKNVEQLLISVLRAVHQMQLLVSKVMVAKSRYPTVHVESIREQQEKEMRSLGSNPLWTN